MQTVQTTDLSSLVRDTFFVPGGSGVKSPNRVRVVFFKYGEKVGFFGKGGRFLCLLSYSVFGISNSKGALERGSVIDIM